MVSADAPLQIGCEVTGRRGTLESWGEGPDADHLTAQSLPRSNKPENTGRKRKRAVKEGRAPGKQASGCGKAVLTS